MFKFKYGFPGEFSSISSLNEYRLMKTGIGFILFGIVLYMLKELLVGLIAIFLFLIGGGFLIKAFKVWKSKNTIHIQ
jgi:hypothetical protein